MRFMCGLVILLYSAICFAHSDEPDWLCSAKTHDAMDTMARAFEDYAVDNRDYPTFRTKEDLVRALVPKYTDEVLWTDGWGNAFTIIIEQAHYWIISYGADGKADSGLYGSDGKPAAKVPHDAKAFTDDIIRSELQFLLSHKKLLESHEQDWHKYLQAHPKPMTAQAKAQAKAAYNELNASALRKQALTDISADAQKIQSYFHDHQKYPVVSTGEIAALKTTITDLPVFSDPWGHSLRYLCFQPQGPFWIMSYGSDGLADANLYNSKGIPDKKHVIYFSQPESDIVYGNGSFVTYSPDEWHQYKPDEILVFIKEDHTFYLERDWVPKPDLLETLTAQHRLYPQKHFRLVSLHAPSNYVEEVSAVLKQANLSQFVVSDE